MSICGYCGKGFIDVSTRDWDSRLAHLDGHKFGQCNQSKKFFRADHFRLHLKHSHAAKSGTWIDHLEAACMNREAPSTDQHNCEEQDTASDHGYSSAKSGIKQQHREQSVSSSSRNYSPEPTNTISMVFSNYALVEISRTGYGKNRNYEFEYWGTNYVWARKRGVVHSGIASYSLCKSSSRDKILAHIKVQEFDEFEIRAGHSAGGWIPRALMRITDEEIINLQSSRNDLPE